MSEVFCPGGTQKPLEERDRDMPRYSGRGKCPECDGWYKLTAAGLIRRHKVAAAAQETAEGDEQPKPGGKVNPTPDLTDEQYLEQMVLIAQAIAVMPAQREGLPNVTTPPPIRPLWAKFLISMGLRIDPKVATHKLRNPNTPAAGNWGPRDHVPLNQRQSLTREDLMKVWEGMNADTFHGIQSGTMTREALLATMPEQMREAVRLAEELHRKQSEGAAGGDPS